MGDMVRLDQLETFQNLTASGESAELYAGCWCKGNPKRAMQSNWDSETRQTRYTYCPCPIGQQCESDAKEAEDRRREEAREQRIEMRWDNSDVPSRYSGATLDDARPEHAAIVKLMHAAITDTECPSWYLWGKAGSGKTWLACAYLWADLVGSKGLRRPKFVTLPDLLGMLRSSYQSRSRHDEAEDPRDTEEDIIQRMIAAHPLLLDDLGAEAVANQDWEADRLYRIIGGRYNAEEPTIFTSNLSLKQLAERIGSRIVGRMVEMIGEDHIIEVPGPNLRLKK